MNLQDDVPFALMNAPDQEMKEFGIDDMSADSGFREQMQVDDAGSIEKLKMKLKFSECSNPAGEPVRCLFEQRCMQRSLYSGSSGSMLAGNHLADDGFKRYDRALDILGDS